MEIIAILLFLLWEIHDCVEVLLLSGRYYKIKVELSLRKVLKHTFCFRHETSQTFRKVERVVI